MSGPAGTSKPSRLFSGRALLILLGIILSLLSLEGLLRLSGYTPYYLDADAFMPSQDPDMRYELRPGFTGLYAGTPLSINSQGLRGAEIPDPDGATAAFPIVIAGDSFAFGQGLRHEETLSEQLAAGLHATSRGKDVGVINLGVPGYNTCQEYLRFKQRGLPFHPNTVVLVYVDNDTDSPPFQVRDNAVVSSDVQPGRFATLLAALRKASYLYNFAWFRWQRLKPHGMSLEEYRALLTARFDPASPSWQRSRACMVQFIALARLNSARVIVIPFPVLAALEVQPYPFTVYTETICNAARLDGAECLDVLPAIRQAPPPLTTVDGHPSATVFARVAAVLSSVLSTSLPRLNDRLARGPSFGAVSAECATCAPSEPLTRFDESNLGQASPSLHPLASARRRIGGILEKSAPDRTSYAGALGA